MSGGGSGGSTVQETKIPQELRPLALQQGEVGADALWRLNQQSKNAGANQLVAGFTPEEERGFSMAEAAVTNGGVIPEVTDQLRGTARGDFLYGTPAFDAAVQASIRAAQPNILSTFGRAGGTPGGLASVAMQQVASDAFAGLYSQERQRQQAAQLALPQLSLIPSDVLSSIGAERRGMNQQRLMAPITAQQMLLEASGSGIPLSSLLGSSTTGGGGGRSRIAGGLTGALGGAATGAAIGSVVPVIGTGFGAAAGGLIGALGGAM